MKKSIPLFLVIALVLSLICTAFTGAADPPDDFPDAEELFYLSDGAAVNDYSIENGSINVNVSLPADGYLQFKQPVRDLISGDNGKGLLINLDGHEIGDPLGTTDAEIAAAYPELWTAYSDSSYKLKVGLSTNPDGEAAPEASWTIWRHPGRPSPRYYAQTDGKPEPNQDFFLTDFQTELANGFGYRPTFSYEAGSKICLGPVGTNHGRIVALTSVDFAPAVTAGIYVRVGTNLARTFNIQLNSTDIVWGDDGGDGGDIDTSNDLTDENGIIYVKNNSGEASMNGVEVVNGSITVSVTLNEGDYVQIMQPVSDLIDGNAGGLQVNLGNHQPGKILGNPLGSTDALILDSAERYKAANFRVQLTNLEDPLKPAPASWSFGAVPAGNAENLGLWYMTASKTGGSYGMWGPIWIAMRDNGFIYRPTFSLDSGYVYMGPLFTTDIPPFTKEKSLTLFEPGDEPVYVRVYSGKTETYNIRLSSPDIEGGGGGEILTPETIFLNKFMDSLAEIRTGNTAVIMDLKTEWDALSYMEKSNVEGTLIDDDELWDLLMVIKTYNSDGGFGGDKEDEDEVGPGSNVDTGQNSTVPLHMLLVVSLAGILLIMRRRTVKNK